MSFLHPSAGLLRPFTLACTFFVQPDNATRRDRLLKALPPRSSNVPEPYEGGKGQKHARRNEDQCYCEIRSNVIRNAPKNKKSGRERQWRNAHRH